MVQYITEDVIDAARRMLDNGVPADEVASELGVGRSTVYKIQNGTYQARARKVGHHKGTPAGPMRRCPGCGGMIVTDVCLLCEGRRTI